MCPGGMDVPSQLCLYNTVEGRHNVLQLEVLGVAHNCTKLPLSFRHRQSLPALSILFFPQDTLLFFHPRPSEKRLRVEGKGGGVIAYWVILCPCLLQDCPVTVL